MYSYDIGEEGGQNNDDDKGYQLINQINQFNRNYKRKPKRFRKLGAPNIDMLDNIQSQQYRQRTIEKKNNKQEEQDQEGSFLMSRCSYQQLQKEDEEKPQPIRTQQKKIIIPIILTSQTNTSEPKKKLEEHYDEPFKLFRGHGVGPEVLEDLGLLEDDLRLPPQPFLTRKATSQQSRLSSQPKESNEQFKFFEDSENNQLRLMGLMGVPALSSHKKDSSFIEEDKLFHE